MVKDYTGCRITIPARNEAGVSDIYDGTILGHLGDDVLVELTARTTGKTLVTTMPVTALDNRETPPPAWGTPVPQR